MRAVLAVVGRPQLAEDQLRGGVRQGPGRPGGTPSRHPASRARVVAYRARRRGVAAASAQRDLPLALAAERIPSGWPQCGFDASLLTALRRLNSAARSDRAADFRGPSPTRSPGRCRSRPERSGWICLAASRRCARIPPRMITDADHERPPCHTDTDVLSAARDFLSGCPWPAPRCGTIVARGQARRHRHRLSPCDGHAWPMAERPSGDHRLRAFRCHAAAAYGPRRNCIPRADVGRVQGTCARTASSAERHARDGRTSAGLTLPRGTIPGPPLVAATVRGRSSQRLSGQSRLRSRHAGWSQAPGYGGPRPVVLPAATVIQIAPLGARLPRGPRSRSLPGARWSARAVVTPARDALQLSCPRRGLPGHGRRRRVLRDTGVSVMILG